MKAICMPAFSRPELLQQTLECLRLNDLRDWKLFVSIDNGGDETINSILKEMDALPTDIAHQPWNLSCSLNSFMVCQRAIDQGAEAVLFMDDDIHLSPDALTLCNWYLGHPGLLNPATHAGIALCRRFDTDIGQPNAVSTVETFYGHLGQGWCFTRDQWFSFVLRNWFYHEPEMGANDTYDWALCHMALKLNRTILRPKLARARHAGAVGYHGAGIGVFPDVVSDGSHRDYTLV